MVSFKIFNYILNFDCNMIVFVLTFLIEIDVEGKLETRIGFNLLIDIFMPISLIFQCNKVNIFDEFIKICSYY